MHLQHYSPASPYQYFRQTRRLQPPEAPYQSAPAGAGRIACSGVTALPSRVTAPRTEVLPCPIQHQGLAGSLGTLSIPSPEWLAVLYSLALRFELHQCFLFPTFAGLNFSLPPLQERR
ncbi:protein of unknown function [Nitrospira defluvii]|uniref:Uncharacterized protein n=1 Tax=Nitrospira defluvii TaxID=330214 RepID=D8PGN6_9BACT|nr:protein of unknown function [Nitrospira defluvii]